MDTPPEYLQGGSQAIPKTNEEIIDYLFQEKMIKLQIFRQDDADAAHQLSVSFLPYNANWSAFLRSIEAELYLKVFHLDSVRLPSSTIYLNSEMWKKIGPMVSKLDVAVRYHTAETRARYEAKIKAANEKHDHVDKLKKNNKNKREVHGDVHKENDQTQTCGKRYRVKKWLLKLW